MSSHRILEDTVSKPDHPTSSSPIAQSFQVTPQQTKRMTGLKTRIMQLEQQISDVEEQQREVDRQLKTSDAAATVKDHIKLLHDYNEIRDIGQGLLGIIADQRGVRVVDIYKDFDVSEGD